MQADDDQQQDPQTPQAVDGDSTTYSETDDDLKHQAAESPAVRGGKDPFSGSAPEEAADIDAAMKELGIELDPEHPTPVGD